MARLKYPLIKLWLTSNLGIDSNLCYVAIKVIFPSSSSSSLEPTSPPNRIHIDEADNKPKSGQSLRRNRKQVLPERWLLPRYLPPPPFPCEPASSLTTNPTLTTLSFDTVFAGHDASRALALTSTKPEDVRPDWEDLDDKEKQTLDDWMTFFSKRYNVVGLVTSPRSASTPA